MGERRKVVIVDDSPFMRDLLSGFFANKLGFQVLATGSNGIHAVALYKQHRPDLITLDITMPVKDGKDALKEILEVHPEARVLLITALVGSPVVECLKLGAADYVEKPLELDNPLFVEEFTAIVDQAMSS